MSGDHILKGRITLGKRQNDDNEIASGEALFGDAVEGAGSVIGKSTPLIFL